MLVRITGVTTFLALRPTGCVLLGLGPVYASVGAFGTGDGKRGALAGSLGPGVHADVLVKDKVPDDGWPGRVRGDVVVVLWCEGTEGRETGPGDGWEVVVLVVVSDLRDYLDMGVRGMMRYSRCKREC